MFWFPHDALEAMQRLYLLQISSRCLPSTFSYPRPKLRLPTARNAWWVFMEGRITRSEQGKENQEKYDSDDI